MRRLASAYGGLIRGLAAVAGALIAFVFAAVVYDVTLRSAGLNPPDFTSALSEYALLYMTMLAAPWLVRERAHVAVASFIVRVPQPLREWIERSIYVGCVGICLGLAYYAGVLALDAASRGEMDIRSIEIPRWMYYAASPIGFGLCAIEFSRLLVLRQSLHSSREPPAGQP